MKYQDTCLIVTQRAGVDRGEAERTVKGVLQALADQTDHRTFGALRSELPAEFAKTTEPAEHLVGRTLDEFLNEVALRGEIPLRRARRGVLAVFAALAAGAPDAFPAVVRAAGDAYAELLPPPVELRAPAVFLETVAHRAGTDTSDAESATHATLDALAERITGGQAADLAAYLPTTMRSRLEGVGEAAGAFDYGEFLGKIAGQRNQAEVYAAAVLGTVREAAPEPEIQDTLAQLPYDLARLFT